jgi:hypothetical protein
LQIVARRWSAPVEVRRQGFEPHPRSAQLLSTNRAQPLVDRTAGRLGQPVQRNRGRKQQADLVLLTDQQ